MINAIESSTTSKADALLFVEEIKKYIESLRHLSINFIENVFIGHAASLKVIISDLKTGIAKVICPCGEKLIIKEVLNPWIPVKTKDLLIEIERYKAESLVAFFSPMTLEEFLTKQSISFTRVDDTSLKFDIEIKSNLF